MVGHRSAEDLSARIKTVCSRFTAIGASWADGDMRRLPLLPSDTSLRTSLLYLFLVCPWRLLVCIKSLHKPIVLVPTHARSVAFISLNARPSNEGQTSAIHA